VHEHVPLQSGMNEDTKVTPMKMLLKVTPMKMLPSKHMNEHVNEEEEESNNEYDPNKVIKR
jgi:hypothetical protein